MFLASYLLAGLAIILAWPVPILLSRAAWTARSPFAALVLWQAIALAGGLSMIGAMLTWGLEPLGDNLPAAFRALWGILIHGEPATTLGLVHVFALSAALLLGAHLVFTLLLTYYRITRDRRRHRSMLQLLSSPSPDYGATVVVPYAAPVAYCLPGGGRAVTVLSDGLLEMLTPGELQAVLTHERAHLLQRHHLLLWAFAAWRAALPWLPTSQLAQQAVHELIEMLADDEALREVDRPTMVRALALVANGSAPLPPDTAPDGPPALGGAQSSEPVDAARRLGRLLTPRPPLAAWQRALVLLAALALVAVPTVLLLAPQLVPWR